MECEKYIIRRLNIEFDKSNSYKMLFRTNGRKEKELHFIMSGGTWRVKD